MIKKGKSTSVSLKLYCICIQSNCNYIYSLSKNIIGSGMQSSSREIPELRIFEKWSNPCVPNLPKMKLKYVISFSASINVYSFCRFTVYSNLHNFKPFGPFGIILCLTFFMILSILSSFSILSNFLAFGTF